MITRFNYSPPPKRDKSHDDEFSTFTYEKQIIVLSTHKDGSVDKYEERPYWKEDKSSWAKYINSFDIGTVQEQVMNHLNKGTPLVTAHVLPPADYTKLEQGATIKREMLQKGITIDMIVDAIKKQFEPSQEEVKGDSENA